LDFSQWVFLIALDGEKIIGSVRGRQDGDRCYIKNLSIDPKHNNIDLKKQLLYAIESYFQFALFYEVHTDLKDEKGQSLFKEFGYQESNRKKMANESTKIYFEKEKF